MVVRQKNTPMNLKRNHVSLAHTEADIDLTLQAYEDVIREPAASPTARRPTAWH